MENWKVFEIDGVDFVCARSEEEARKFYFDEIMLDPVQDCEEIDINTVGMWYGFELDFPESRKLLIDLLNENKEKVYELKYDVTRNSDVVVYLTFDEVIKLDNPKEPYIIATTEW